MGETFNWMAGVSLHRPKISTFYGMPIIESEHVPEGMAYIMPDRQMIVPKGLADKIVSVETHTDTRDVSSPDGYTQRVKVGETTTAEIVDGGMLTVEKYEAMAARVRELVEGKITEQLYGKPAAPKADPEKVAMEADPLWGAF
jgi:hypothetical protein